MPDPDLISQVYAALDADDATDDLRRMVQALIQEGLQSTAQLLRELAAARLTSSPSPLAADDATHAEVLNILSSSITGSHDNGLGLVAIAQEAARQLADGQTHTAAIERIATLVGRSGKPPATIVERVGDLVTEHADDERRLIDVMNALSISDGRGDAVANAARALREERDRAVADLWALRDRLHALLVPTVGDGGVSTPTDSVARIPRGIPLSPFLKEPPIDWESFLHRFGLKTINTWTSGDGMSVEITSHAGATGSQPVAWRTAVSLDAAVETAVKIIIGRWKAVAYPDHPSAKCLCVECEGKWKDRR